MSFLIEKDEGTAARRRIPMRLFTSNGTSPDTGASNDSVILAVNSATTITPDCLVTAIHAAQGMYYAELSASNVSVLGTHAVYHVQGDFPHHVANIDIVNFNPYSSFSNIAVKTYSGVTVGSLATIVAGDYGSSITFGVSTIKAGTYSGVTVGSAATILAGTYSGVTVGINNIAAGTYSAVTVGSLATIVAGDYSSTITFGVSKILAGTYSGVTVGSLATIVAGDYSSTITFGISKIKAGTYSGVTVGINDIAAATYSGVTVGSYATLVPADYTSKVTVGVGGYNAGVITTAAFAAAALDSTVFATNAEQAFADRFLLRSIAGGADSGRTVGTALYPLRNKVDASGSVGTVYQVDDATSAWTFSTTTAAFPISSVDP